MSKLTIRVTPEDDGLIARAVRASGKTKQDWTLEVLLEAAGKDIVDPLSRSRIFQELAETMVVVRSISELEATRYPDDVRERLRQRAAHRYERLFGDASARSGSVAKRRDRS